MVLFYRKKIIFIVLSAVLVTASLLFTSFSSAASSTAHAKTTSQTEWAYVANNGSRSVTIIDTKTKKEITTIPVEKGPDSIAVTSNGKKAYVLNRGSHSISVIDAQNKKVTATILLDETMVHVAAITQDEKYVYVAGHGTLSIIDIEKEKVVKKLRLGDYNYVVATAPDGKQVYLASLGKISVIDTEKQEICKTISLEGDYMPYAVTFSPNGKRAYAAIEQAVLVIDTEQEKVIHTIPITGSLFTAYEAVTSPNGNYIYVAGRNNTSSQVLVVNAKTYSIIKTIHVKEDPLGMDITSDGKEVYITNCDHDVISVLDTQTYRVRHSIPVGSQPSQVTIATSPE
jgi:YVTN family beta-propeller protein